MMVLIQLIKTIIMLPLLLTLSALLLIFIFGLFGLNIGFIGGYGITFGLIVLAIIGYAGETDEDGLESVEEE